MEDRWKNRKKTGIVEKMRHAAGVTVPELSNILCTSKEYINNKKNRNSFSFEDILKIATFCGYRIRFDRVNDAVNSFVIDPNEFLENDELYLKVVDALKEKRLREMEDLELKKHKKVKGDIGGLFYNEIIQNDIDALMQLPSAQPEIIYCKDCIHRPIANDPDAKDGFGLKFPDFRCPCGCDDPYYSWMPKDNWFCGNGEKEEKTNERESREASERKA